MPLRTMCAMGLGHPGLLLTLQGRYPVRRRWLRHARRAPVCQGSPNATQVGAHMLQLSQKQRSASPRCPS